ncbi:transposase [Streptomyces sp. NPDC001858]
MSYLPDPQAYLADLPRSRERLMSAFSVDDWARSEAMPSHEEIRRVRQLIERVKADLGDLTAEEQAQIGEAVAVVCRSRSVMLGMPRSGRPLPGVHTTRTAWTPPWPTAAARTANAVASA